jgi:peptide/nickel transport system substrate-binding protein
VIKPIVEEQGVAEVNSLWGVDTDVSEILSCGPWLLSEYVPSQRVVFKKNPDYFEKDAEGNSLPYLDELVYETIESDDTQLARAVAGDLDFYSLSGDDYAVLVEKKEEVGFELYNVGPSTSTEFITFNQNPIEGEDDNGISPPQLTWLSNLKFRTAMAHVIDREAIINNIAYGFGYPQYSFVPRFSPYYWDGVDDAAPKYDPEKAKELLDEIGYVDTDDDGIREDPDGNMISLNLYTNSGNTTREQIGTLFAQEAAKVGIQVNFQPEDFNALVTRLVSSYDWELVLIGLTGSVDPISGSNVYPSSGSLHMIEPNQESPRRDWEKAVDEAWDEANNTTDEAQRKSGYEKLQRLWVENLPWAYTYNAAIMHLYDKNLGNIQPQPTEGYDWEGILTRLYYKEQ